MFDSETLRPVIIAMTLYLVISNVLPKLIKKPTGFKPIDEINMMLISQSGFLMAGTILTGVIVFLTNYINTDVL
jgi:hypothetical protein